MLRSVLRRLTAWRRVLNRVDRGDLDWLADQVWGVPGGSRAWCLDAPPPADWEAVDAYLVLPSADRPLVVVPRLSRRAIVRALSARPRLQSKANLLVRMGAATALALAVPNRVPGDVLLVEGGAGTTDTADEPPRLLGHLSLVLGEDVRALIVPGRQDPNRKPTLELLTDDGRSVGFAKVGWNAQTRDLVRNEARQLRLLARVRDSSEGQRLPATPHVLAHLDLPSTSTVVTKPMPGRARARSNAAPPPNDAMAAVASALSSTGGRLEHQRMHELGIWVRHRSALARAGDDPELGPAAGVLLTALNEALDDADSDAAVPVGGWHGDWTPWNMASVGQTLWVWDWEHAGQDVPFGFDLCHYLFQVDVEVARSSPTQAVNGLRMQAPAALGELGVPASAATAVATGYLVEVWLRARRLRTEVSGWNPVIHPGIAHALDT